MYIRCTVGNILEDITNHLLTVCILMDYLTHIDMSMGLPILYFKGLLVEVSEF